MNSQDCIGFYNAHPVFLLAIDRRLCVLHQHTNRYSCETMNSVQSLPLFYHIGYGSLGYYLKSFSIPIFSFSSFCKQIMYTLTLTVLLSMSSFIQANAGAPVAPRAPHAALGILGPFFSHLPSFPQLASFSHPHQTQHPHPTQHPVPEVVDCSPYKLGGAPGSCENICWYLNCHKGKNSFTCGGDADKNRKLSGCGRHPCSGKYAKKEPFKAL